MILAQCKWKYDSNVKGVQTKENGELQSAIFPGYLPDKKKIALPTLEELVTPGNKIRFCSQTFRNRSKNNYGANRFNQRKHCYKRRK